MIDEDDEEMINSEYDDGDDDDSDEDIIAAYQNIGTGFNILCKIHGYEKAWHDLEDYLKQRKPPPKPKGKHRPRMDAELLAAHKHNPRGKKLEAVYEVGARYGCSRDAALRRLRRLLAEKKRFDALSEALLQKILEERDALREERENQKGVI
jgi:hypothetical protein